MIHLELTLSHNAYGGAEYDSFVKKNEMKVLCRRMAQLESLTIDTNWICADCLVTIAHCFPKLRKLSLDVYNMEVLEEDEDDVGMKQVEEAISMILDHHGEKLEALRIPGDLSWEMLEDQEISTNFRDIFASFPHLQEMCVCKVVALTKHPLRASLTPFKHDTPCDKVPDHSVTPQVTKVPIQA